MSKPRARPDPPLSHSADTVFRTYLAQCRRLGVKPAPSAREQIKQWTDEFAARQDPPAAQIDAGATLRTSDVLR